MADLSPYRGLHALGPAWEVVLRNDAHPRGSVDRTLMEGMVALCPETAPALYDPARVPAVVYRAGMRPELETIVSDLLAGTTGDEEQVDGIAARCSHLKDDSSDDLDAVRLGGTEEEILRRGSEECADVARVACALYQVAGFPSRPVYTAHARDPYCGHVLVEVSRRGRWGALDPLCHVVYQWPDARPATAWELMGNHALIEAHARPQGTPYTTPGQFGRCAVSAYRFGDVGWYDYSVGGVNDYYRAILKMAQGGWPGGFRWLFGEDRAEEAEPHE